jgi:hypothetical protein
MNQWLLDIFNADQAHSGGVVRRSTRNVATFGASGGGLAALVGDHRNSPGSISESPQLTRPGWAAQA